MSVTVLTLDAAQQTETHKSPRIGFWAPGCRTPTPSGGRLRPETFVESLPRRCSRIPVAGGRRLREERADLWSQISGVCGLEGSSIHSSTAAPARVGWELHASLKSCVVWMHWCCRLWVVFVLFRATVSEREWIRWLGRRWISGGGNWGPRLADHRGCQLSAAIVVVGLHSDITPSSSIAEWTICEFRIVFLMWWGWESRRCLLSVGPDKKHGGISKTCSWVMVE